jgi:hypothetical protein
MIFVYPYHSRAESDFEIKQSIAMVLKLYPGVEIWTVGKAVPGIKNIPCTQHNNIRGCDVTNRILTFAKKIGGDFIYMNKDFYITKSWQSHVAINMGSIIVNPEHAPHTQIAQQNTLEFLKHNNFTAYNFETHTPVMMNSQKLIDLFDNINWQNDNHFIKSIYCNVYQAPSKEGFNCKVSNPSIAKAQEFIAIQGCFSTGDNFWNKPCVEWIKSLI